VELRVPLLAFAASRGLVLLAAVVASLELGVSGSLDASVPRALGVLGAWDTTWYLEIARYGYAFDYGQVGVVHTNHAFFPGLPILMATALAVGLNPFALALLAANVSFLAALVGLHVLTKSVWDEQTADRAVWCLALFPPAIFASLAYTEGITLALAVGAALAAYRGRLALAGLAAGGAALMRPTGLLVVLLVALLVAREPRPDRVWRVALVVAPTVAALGAFLTWMRLERGSATLPFEAQAAWDRGAIGLEMVSRLTGELVALLERLVELRITLSWTADLRDILFTLVYVTLLVLLWRAFGGLRSPWVVYSLAMLVLPLSSGTFTSMARVGLLAFPLVWPLAEWVGRNPRRGRPAIAIAIAFMLLGVAQLALRSP
jgi:hypothetical protein